jgi:hypothetical protein
VLEGGGPDGVARGIVGRARAACPRRDQVPIRRGCRFEPPVIPRPAGRTRIKEITMTRRIRLWTAAVLSIAATALMGGLTFAAQADVHHAHPRPTLAGIAGAVPASARGAHPAEPLERGFLLDHGRYSRFDAPRGEVGTVASGINARGRLVGSYVDADHTAHGYLRWRGHYTTIDVPWASATSTSAVLSYPGSELLDINDRGEMVGAYTGADGKAHGYLRSRGRYTRIDVAGAAETVPFGLNNLGEVSGTYLDVTGLPHGFWQDRHGHITTVDIPGVFATSVLDINDQGVLVGTAFGSPATSQGFLRDRRGRVTTFAVPAAPSRTAASGINNQLQVVGQYTTADGTTHGFRRSQRGHFTTIDVPGAGPFTSPVHTNSRNQVVGTYQPLGAASPAPTSSTASTAEPTDGSTNPPIMKVPSP